MKKIVYIGNNLTSGNPTTLVTLSEILIESDFKVKIYSSKKNKLFRLLDMITGVFKNLNAHYVLIDTYSTFNFYYALIISQLCRVFKIKYIPILHGGSLPKRLKNNPYLCNLLFNNSYKNVSPSSYLREVFEDNNYKTVFIPNVLNTNLFNFKQRKNFQANLLWVRAFDKIYNPEMAIHVVNKLKKKGVNTNLCMVGPDKDGSLVKVKELTKKIGLQDFVEFTGYMSKEDWIQKSTEFDIFINTTTIDNIPVSVLEAMALGLPVVSTNVGGIPYLINHNTNGLLVEIDNAEGMSKAIVDLIDKPDVALRIAKRARLTAENFDVDKLKNKWVEILN